MLTDVFAGWRCPRAFGLPFLVACLGLVAGCGGGKGGGGVGENSVSGKVTLGDKPVSGIIVFVYSDSKEAEAPIGPDGGYMLPDAKPGMAKIYIKPPVSGSSLTMPKGSPDVPKDGPANTMAVPPPDKYRSVASSGLTYEIKAGKQTYDIPLK